MKSIKILSLNFWENIFSTRLTGQNVFLHFKFGTFRLKTKANIHFSLFFPNVMKSPIKSYGTSTNVLYYIFYVFYFEMLLDIIYNCKVNEGRSPDPYVYHLHV